VVELADTQDLGSCVARCAGSSPVTRTISKVKDGYHEIEGSGIHFSLQKFFVFLE
jgi:hypothetical protein